MLFKTLLEGVEGHAGRCEIYLSGYTTQHSLGKGETPMFCTRYGSEGGPERDGEMPPVNNKAELIY